MFSYTVANVSKTEMAALLSALSDMKKKQTDGNEGNPKGADGKEKETNLVSESTQKKSKNEQESEKEKDKNLDSESTTEKSKNEQESESQIKETEQMQHAKNVQETKDHGGSSGSRSPTNFTSEADIATQEENRVYVCLACYDKDIPQSVRKSFFADERAFDVHIELHSNEELEVKLVKVKSYPCTLMNCNSFFATYLGQLDHRLCHPEFYCEYCKQFLGSSHLLANHMVACHVRIEHAAKKAAGAFSG